MRKVVGRIGLAGGDVGRDRSVEFLASDARSALVVFAEHATHLGPPSPGKGPVVDYSVLGSNGEGRDAGELSVTGRIADEHLPIKGRRLSVSSTTHAIDAKNSHVSSRKVQTGHGAGRGERHGLQRSHQLVRRVGDGNQPR